MLGAVNTIFGSMMKQYEKAALAWAKECHVQREITHKGPAFKGNSCQILLSKVDLLRRKKNLGILKYVKVLEDFKSCVKACFGNDLDSNFLNYIDAFKSSYIDLGINITPKIHAIIFHVPEFCKNN